MSEHEHTSVVKGLAAGLAGGLVASWVMNQVPTPSSPTLEQKTDDATVKAAAAISENVADHRLTRQEKTTAGPLVHYAFGTLMGALYGAVAEVWRPARAAWGLPFGTALWIAADEVAVPALGLSGSPADTPASMHAYALGVHLIYGATTDAVRRGVRAALAER